MSYTKHLFTQYLLIIYELDTMQATLEMKGEKELKALLDILALDSSVYARIQVSVR